MKKSILFILGVIMMCSLVGCSLGCSVSGCDEEVTEDGLCAYHNLKKSIDECNKIEAEIEALEAERDLIQSILDSNN